MNQGLLLAGCLLLGARGGCAAAVLASPPPPPVPMPPPSGAPAAAPAPDLDRFERRLEERSAAVGARNAAAPLPPGAPPSASPADGSLAGRVAELEKRGAALGAAPARAGAPAGPALPENLGAVGSKDLEGLARTFMELKRYDDAGKALKELLARTDLSEESRFEAELQFGYSLRGAGRNAEAEAHFVETLARVGEDTRQGAQVGFQLGWEKFFQKDLAGASARMEKTANTAGVEPSTRFHALYNAAYFAREAGDRERALAFLERLFADHGNEFPAGVPAMKAQAEAWLKELRGN